MGDTASSTWQITGVQLELGSTATDFEHRSYGDELLKCQRYLYRLDADDGVLVGIPGYANSTSAFSYSVKFPVRMRAVPTYTGSATDARFAANDVSTGTDLSTFTIHATGTTDSMNIYQGSAGGGTAGQAGTLQFQADNGYIQFTADL